MVSFFPHLRTAERGALPSDTITLELQPDGREVLAADADELLQLAHLDRGELLVGLLRGPVGWDACVSLKQE